MGTLLGALVLVSFLGLMVAALVKQHDIRLRRRMEIDAEDQELKKDIQAKYPSVKMSDESVGDEAAFKPLKPLQKHDPLTCDVCRFLGGEGGDGVK